jgi:hypothetical protein
MEFIEFTDALEGSAAVKGLVVPEATPATALDLADAIKLIRPEGEELLIVSADHALATLVVQMTHLAAQNKLIATRLVDAMLAPGSPVSPASARQAQRNAEARKELIDEFGLRESDELAELAGSTASNRSATASRWLAAGKIFAVNHQGARVFPGFQFGTDGHPRPVIGRVLEVFEPYGLDGWETALWFTTASGWLDDQRPVDMLTREPEQVVEAARHAFEEVAA